MNSHIFRLFLRKKMRTLNCVVVMLIIIACNKSNKPDNPPAPPSNPKPAAFKGVLTAGVMEGPGGKTLAVYWRNDSLVKLSGGTTDARALWIMKTANDIYVAGDTTTPAGRRVAVYWKNGVSHALSNGSTNAEARCITNFGSDIYVAGIITDLNNRSAATYWKNEVAVTLPTDSAGQSSTANAIVVSNGDVYVGGQVMSADQKSANPVYWNNGKLFPLSTGSPNIAEISDLGFNSNQTLFLSGTYQLPTGDHTAALFQKGSQFLLMNDSHYTKANGLYIDGLQSYVAGMMRDKSKMNGDAATIWINGKPVTQHNALATNSRCNAVFVVDTVVYGAGYLTASTNKTMATVWLNGEPVRLADSNYNSFATKIVVGK
jgi:hypothetical protein